MSQSIRPSDRTVSSEVARALAAHVTDCFGLMGNGNAYLLDALLSDPAHAVRFTAVRHEAGAVVAADAYYRASGRLAVATATYGAGFTNTITALTEAVQARTPLLLVVGDAPTSGPRPWDVDQTGMAAAAGAATFTLSATDPATTALTAIEHALTNRTAAVLAIPYDLAAAPAVGTGELPAVSLPEPPTCDDAALDAVAELLAGARRPFLLAGHGAWLSGASDELGRLAEATGAVTASSALGRGSFPDSRYDLGVAGGFGQEKAMALVHGADVAVVLGASLNQFTTRFGSLFAPGTRVVQIDIGDRATNDRVTDFVRSDAKSAAAGLAARLDGTPSSGWRESIDFAPLRERDRGDDVAPDGRLDPRNVAHRIGELLPDDRVVVSDGGHFIGWANMYWPVASPDRMMMVGTAFQSIGLGLASVPGAAAAHPESTIVLTTGDGGGLMALADLETAVRTAGGRGMAVVWNDTAYGAEVNLYGLKGLAEEPMRIPQVDFAAVARGFGADGVAVGALDDLSALADWAARPASERQFLLLDCRVSPHVIAPYQHEIIAVNS
ncbi:thiamine pyrophosphate-binding protein [Spelaeicoccus albus]|uniref:Thiamine pyrophosphate-dependent acetolactate synthase large subunit-like protein n=1 Tax=Spelaeicoccus albus TaxID=1280376 RepID=A0A7Z0AA25_9MICO|nr:thiamine pyrophosphate-binding protein [Spelaeicoccus albus]NYI67169.1 thiamine pyrophosphate-dependent acetolactate synthase large subunit-like protein [Spelaeicoccus albus]